MTIARMSLYLWYAHKSNKLHAVAQAKGEIRHYLHQKYMDYKPRGKGAKAWKRAAQIESSSSVLVWPDYLR